MFSKLTKPSLAGPGLVEGLSILKGADLHENNVSFIIKLVFESFLFISEPSGTRKGIRLQILRRVGPVLVGGLEVNM